MNWNNVKLILAREVRDQLRDRRTLFMIAVLPLLLYPLLGMSFFQVAQFLREQPTRVLVVNLPASPGLPALVEDHHFAASLFGEKPERAKLLRVDLCETPAAAEAAAAQLPAAPPDHPEETDRVATTGAAASDNKLDVCAAPRRPIFATRSMSSGTTSCSSSPPILPPD